MAFSSTELARHILDLGPAFAAYGERQTVDSAYLQGLTERETGILFALIPQNHQTRLESLFSKMLEPAPAVVAAAAEEAPPAELCDVPVVAETEEKGRPPAKVCEDTPAVVDAVAQEEVPPPTFANDEINELKSNIQKLAIKTEGGVSQPDGKKKRKKQKRKKKADVTDEDSSTIPTDGTDGGSSTSRPSPPTIISQNEASSHQPGERITLVDLKATEYNGLPGEVLSNMSNLGRHEVRVELELEKTVYLKFKPANLTPRGRSEIVGGRIALAALEGRGKGYVAVKTIKKGDVLLKDTAFCTTSHAKSENHQDLMRQCMGESETQFFKEEVMALATADSRPSFSVRETMGRILTNNVFECSRSPKHSALFVAASRFNHSCCANAYADASPDRMFVRALQDIGIGQEVCISYISLFHSYDKRRCMFLSRGFECACARCQQERAIGIDSQYAVTCMCGKGYFDAQSSIKQACGMCEMVFDPGSSLQRLSKIMEINAYMRTPEAAGRDPRELLRLLQPHADALGTVASSAPPTNVHSVQLLNNVANCHYFAATRIPGDHVTRSFRAFLKYKAQNLEQQETPGTNLLSGNYFQSFHRLMMGEFPSAKEKKKWQLKLAAACTLHFGGPEIPKGIIENVYV